MEELLRPIQTSKATVKARPLVAEISSKKPSKITSPEAALDVLKHSPDIASLRATVSYLSEEHEVWNIKSPSAATTRILIVLIHEVVPAYWSQLMEDSSLEALRDSILEILRSVPTIGSILFRLKSFITAYETPGEIEIKFSSSAAACLLSLLQMILTPDDFVVRVWKDIQTFQPSSGGSVEAFRIMLWKDFIAMISSGRIISIAANVEGVLQKAGDPIDSTWMSKGPDYAQWLTKNLIHLFVNSDGQASITPKPGADLFSKALSLGYSGTQSPSEVEE
jgi:telomere length regulation protein